MLSWETASERDNDFFEVQRSADGLEWDVLGKVTASVDAEDGSSYNFPDNAPLVGINLYRLRQVDYDGSFAFSSIVQLNSELGEQEAAFPNPFEKRFVIPVTGEVKTFSILSVDGRDLTGEVKHRFEDGRIIVRGDQLPSGSYIIRYNDKVTVAVKK